MDNIIVINKTLEVIKVALSKTPYQAPAYRFFTWSVEKIREGGKATVTVPADYQVYASYSQDPVKREDPYAGDKTNVVAIKVPTARFLVKEGTAGKEGGSSVVLERVFTELIPDQIHIENKLPYGVWGHIKLGDSDVYAPQVITPGRVLMEDIRIPLYLAVVDPMVCAGDTTDSLRSDPQMVRPGNTVTITGDIWKGYAITVT